MASEAKPKRVIIYVDEAGKEPFTEWLYAPGWSKATTEIANLSAKA